MRGIADQRDERLPLPHDRRAVARQLRVPVLQHIGKGGLQGDVPQQFVALHERVGVVLERVIVGGLDLAQLHVDEAAALGGAVLDHAQILGRKQYAVDVPHQLAGALKHAAVDLDGLSAQAREQHLHLVAAVALFGLHEHAPRLLPPADQLLIAGRAVAAARAAEHDGLEQRRLALRVVAVEHGHALAGAQLGLLVIAELPKFKAGDVHISVPRCRFRAAYPEFASIMDCISSVFSVLFQAESP